MKILQNRIIHLFYTLMNQENSRAKIYFTYPLPFREGNKDGHLFCQIGYHIFPVHASNIR